MPQILVIPYNPDWPKEFSLASLDVKRALGSNILEIHHIGGTAIPDCWAKPVIDMLAVVTNILAVDLCNASMQSLGYQAMGEFGIPGRRYFRRDVRGQRTHQVHTFQTGSPDVLRHLAFRDFLRAHPDVRDEYAELKRRLAEKHPQDMEAYMDGKDGFIKEVEAKAVKWKATRRKT